MSVRRACVRTGLSLSLLVIAAACPGARAQDAEPADRPATPSDPAPGPAPPPPGQPEAEPAQPEAAPVDSRVQALVTTLALQQDVGRLLDEAAHELHERFGAALEVRSRDPATTDASFEGLPRNEQIAWRAAHLRGLKDALTSIYALVSDEVEGRVAPDERVSLSGLLQRYARGQERVEGLVRALGDEPLPDELRERLELARADWVALSRRLDAATFFSPRRDEGPSAAAAAAATALPPEGFFTARAVEVGERASFFELLREAPDEALSEAGEEAYLPFTVHLLVDLQGLIDPVERQLAALRLEQEQLELERLRELAVSGEETEAGDLAGEPSTLESAPARISRATERFRHHQRVLIDALRERYQQYLQQGRELGDAMAPEELLLQLGGGMRPDLEQEVVRALELAQGEVAPSDGERLPAVRDALEADLARWRDELDGLRPRSIAMDPAAHVRWAMLTMQLRGKTRRLEALEGTIRREESRLRVARQLLGDAVQRVAGVDQRIARLDAMWRDAAVEHYGRSAVKVLVILLAGSLLLRLLSAASRRIVERLASSARFTTDAEARAHTLQSVFVTTLRVVVWVTAGLMILAQFDINYQPLLLATGGITLAVGFGAQSLVKDFFSGFFVLLENQFTVGDVVEIGDKSGVVEAVDLRTTRLRSADGVLHIIPNGQIASVSNLTHTWARMNLLVSVGYGEDPDEVVKVIEQAGRDMFAEPAWKPLLLEAPHVWGLDEFGESSLGFRVVAKTRPGDQWSVSREFRRRLKIAFDLAEIEIPYPYVNYIEAAARPSKVVTSRRRPPGAATSGPAAPLPTGPTTAERAAVADAAAAMTAAAVAERTGDDDAGQRPIDPEREGHRMPT